MNNAAINHVLDNWTATIGRMTTMTDDASTLRDPSGREFPATQPLRWDTDYDNEDNTTWQANSFVEEDEDTPFRYRVDPILRDDRIRYTVGLSDGELLPIGWKDEDDFDSADAAKAWCQAAEDRIWRDAVAKGEVRRVED